jgi:hypothetical protein
MTDFASEMRDRLATQDNRFTSYPIFVVQQRRRIYGIDMAYCGGEHVGWLHCDGDEAADEERIALERAYEDAGQVPEDYMRCGHIDIWEFVTACLTEQGCRDYVAVNGHNLTERRIFAESGHRNEEWKRLRAHFLGRAQLCA